MIKINNMYFNHDSREIIIDYLESETGQDFHPIYTPRRMVMTFEFADNCKIIDFEKLEKVLSHG